MTLDNLQEGLGDETLALALLLGCLCADEGEHNREGFVEVGKELIGVCFTNGIWTGTPLVMMCVRVCSRE